jgi:hypothetical protein
MNSAGIGNATRDGSAMFPVLRWFAVLWLLVYVPTYAWAYGWANFLFLCNAGVILTALGLIAGNRLILSSQAIAAPVIAVSWALDAGWKLLTGDYLFGAIAYMWDPANPPFARLLSVYHLVWPVLLYYVLRRIGYDRRGWPLQAAIAALFMLLARLLTPAAANINFAFVAPFFDRPLGPAAQHLLLCWTALAGAGYGLTHLLCRRLFPAAVAGNPPLP